MVKILGRPSVQRRRVERLAAVKWGCMSLIVVERAGSRHQPDR
jgi:hypothetical protein